MNLLALALVAGLGAYRIARIVVSEDGPWDVVTRFRAWLKIDKADTWWRRGMACVACVSFWTSLALAFVAVVASTGSLTELLLVWLAAACVCVVLMRRVG